MLPYGSSPACSPPSLYRNKPSRHTSKQLMLELQHSQRQTPWGLAACCVGAPTDDSHLLRTRELKPSRDEGAPCSTPAIKQ
jgi:hypothetical protein